MNRHLAFAAVVTLAVVGTLAVAQMKSGSDEGPAIKVLSAVDIAEKVDGQPARTTTVEVSLAPGASGTPHRHPGAVFGYVLEGEFEFKVEGQPLRILKTGETFYEPTMILHEVSRNPSDKSKTRILAVIVHPRDAKQLVIPEPSKKEN